MNKNDIIDYVMTTPGNTNKAVLSSMLNQIKSEDDDNSLTFSKVNVEIINNSNMDCDVDIYLQSVENNQIINYISAFVLDNNKGIITTENYPSAINLNSGDSVNSEFYLMSNKNFCAVLIQDPEFSLKGTVEGYIEEIYISENGEIYPVFVITGDCTITVSNKE